MSEAKRQATWTWEAYLDWDARQPIRYELVDGQVHAMVGGTAEHNYHRQQFARRASCADAWQTVPGAWPRPEGESGRACPRA
jgi:hypothetical protein